MRAILVLVLAVALGGCIGGYGAAHPNVMGNVDHDAHWEGFGYCGGWGCSDPHPVDLTREEWDEVAAIMYPAALTAEEERIKIGQAIGRLETFAGGKVGYDRDRAGTAAGVLQFGQLDCYSEAANSSTFIHLLHNAGLLDFHEPADPIMRGQATARSWRQTHATATLMETESGVLYAMDSWFFASGHAAVSVEADVWADAWGPEGGVIF